MCRWLLPCASVVILSTANAKSRAAGPGSTLANDLATDGFGAFEAGRYEEANEKLSRALDLVGVPTMALYAARTNVKLGHWVKASELYLLASRLSPKSAAEINQLQAQHEAEKERAELLARVPRLTIELKGEDLETVEVTLDAESVPNALLGANQLVDPGHHVIRATRDGQAVVGELELGERQHKTTALYFARREPLLSHSQTLPSIATSATSADTDADPLGLLPDTNASPGGVTAGPPASPELPHPMPASPDQGRATAERDDHDTTRTIGWVGVGLGGVGLLVGATTGLMAVSARSKLKSNEHCSESVCTNDMGGQVDRYNSLRTWSTIGFVSGALFAATGATVLLTLPNEKTAVQARLVVGPGTATLVGHF